MPEADKNLIGNVDKAMSVWGATRGRLHFILFFSNFPKLNDSMEITKSDYLEVVGTILSTVVGII